MTGSNALILPSQMLSTQDKYTDSLHLYIYRQLKAEKNKKYSCDIYANAEKSRTFANEKRNRDKTKKNPYKNLSEWNKTLSMDFGTRKSTLLIS